MRCRYIIALDTDHYETVEDAREDIEGMTEIIWSEVCGIGDPLPKVLDVYEVKE